MASEFDEMEGLTEKEVVKRLMDMGEEGLPPIPPQSPSGPPTSQPPPDQPPPADGAMPERQPDDDSERLPEPTRRAPEPLREMQAPQSDDPRIGGIMSASEEKRVFGSDSVEELLRDIRDDHKRVLAILEKWDT